jgi:autotransporter-associated beta strand protein
VGVLTLTGGELAATASPASDLGNFHLKGDVTVSGTSKSTISADVRVIQNDTRAFDVASTGDPSGPDLLISGKLGHYNNNSWGYMTKQGDGTMKLTGTVEIGAITVNTTGGKLILEDAAADWGGYTSSGLVNNSIVEFFVTTGSRSTSVPISGSGSMAKSGSGTLTVSGYNSGSGGVTVTGGTLVASKSQQDYGIHTLGYGALTINNGGTLRPTAQWSTSSEWNGTTVGAVTINQGGT